MIRGMKRDCPHCRGSMEGEFLRWSKLGEANALRSCPLCGKEIEFLNHLDELLVRVFTVAAIIVACYFAKDSAGGYAAILTIFAIAGGVIALAYAAVAWRLRDAQRFRKGRNSTVRAAA
jgi:hypothetical protein